MTDQTQATTPAAFPDLPESLRRERKPVTAQPTPAPAPVARAVGGTPQSLKMIKEAAMAKTEPSKLDRLKAMRIANYEESQRAASEAGRNPEAVAARDRLKAEMKAKAKAAGPQRKPLTFKEGIAKAKHAHYLVRIDDTGPTRMFVLTAKNADGIGRVGEFDQADEARNAAADHHFGLASASAPIYKPAPQQKDTTVSAKKKAKPAAKRSAKAKAAKAKTSKRPAKVKAKVAKAAKVKAKASARKPVKGRTTAAKPSAAGKGADVIAKLKAGWTPATELQAFTGWQPHTLRGFLSRARADHSVEAERREGVTHYRIK